MEDPPTCKNCNEPLPPDCPICPNCQQPVQGERQLRDEQPEKCLFCGAELGEGMLLCPGCGRKRDEAAAAACAPAIESAPAVESAPVVESVPVVESAPADEGTPVDAGAPAGGGAPAVTDAPAVEEKTAEDYISNAEKCDTVEDKLRELDEGIRKYPASTELLGRRGSVLALAGNYRGAVLDYTELIRLEPENAAAYDGRAAAYNRLNEPGKALADADKAIRLNPDTAAFYGTRAKARRTKSDFAGALSDYNKAVELDGGGVLFLARRSHLRALMGDYGAAKQDITRAVQLDPDNPVVYFYSGMVCIIEKKWKAAAAEFNKAVKLDSDNAEYLIWRGNARYRNDDTEGAEKDYRKALKLRPDLDKSDINLFWYQPCFITTAVCEALSKRDDCYELTMFRNFRDNWLVKQTGGPQLISRYYRVAPGITAAIGKSPGGAAVYAGIRDTYLCECLRLIESGRFDDCKNLYVKMVTELEKEWGRDAPRNRLSSG